LRVQGFKGTDSHKWGAAPSHYEDEYYEKFNEGLNFILKNKEDYYYERTN